MSDTASTPPTPPATIGDVIAAQLAAQSSQTAASNAAAAADAALASANTGLAGANQTLAMELTLVGAPVFTIDATTGVVTVWVTDTSPAGFHAFEPVPASTPLPTASAPALPPKS